jgi:hypothetical protein
MGQKDISEECILRVFLQFHFTQISTNSHECTYQERYCLQDPGNLVHTSYEISWDNNTTGAGCAGHLFKYLLKLLPGVYTLGKDLYNNPIFHLIKLMILIFYGRLNTGLWNYVYDFSDANKGLWRQRLESISGSSY